MSSEERLSSPGGTAGALSTVGRASTADRTSPGAGSRPRPGRPKGARPSRAERREDLLDAAERAIRRNGPNASMEELATEAGITKPILYSHFGDRAGLAEALAGRTADRLVVAIEDALREASATANSAEVVTRSAIQAFCDFIEREAGIYRFLVRTTFDGPFPLSSHLATEVAARITKMLGRALREVGADSGAAEPWAFGAVGLSFAGAEWWAQRRTMTKGDLVEYLTQLLWGGFSGAGLDRLDLRDARETGEPPSSPEDTPRSSNITRLANRGRGA